MLAVSRTSSIAFALFAVACSPKNNMSSDSSDTSDGGTPSGKDETGTTETTGTEPTGNEPDCQPPKKDPHCGAIESEAECHASNEITNKDGIVIGECNWVKVLRVEDGTCSIESQYSTCIFSPINGDGCGYQSECGSDGFGIYEAVNCKGYHDIVANPPDSAFCEDPLLYATCTDDQLECNCLCP